MEDIEMNVCPICHQPNCNLIWADDYHIIWEKYGNIKFLFDMD